MSKEVLLAIVAGAFFGLIIAFGIWRLNSTLSTNTQNQTEASPTPATTTEFGLTIAEPQDNQVVTESPGLITGLTGPNAFVVVSTAGEDFLTTSSSDGSFEIEVELVGGINQILISSFNNQGQTATKELRIAHSTELSTNQEGETSESTDSSDVVRERVREARNVPYFYTGTVTDIAEGSIQIRNGAGEIKQVSASQDETSYVSLVNDIEEIEFSDIAIGDYILAMGLRGENGVLNSQRILVITPLGEITRQIVFGTIQEIGTREITLEADDETLTLDFPTAWKGPDLDELSEQQSLIAVGEPENGTISIRSIFTTETSEEE